jgi:hypothetical protein
VLGVTGADGVSAAFPLALPFVAAVDAVTGAEMLDVSTGVSSSIRASYSSRSIVVLREIGGGLRLRWPLGEKSGGRIEDITG